MKSTTNTLAKTVTVREDSKGEAAKYRLILDPYGPGSATDKGSIATLAQPAAPPPPPPPPPPPSTSVGSISVTPKILTLAVGGGSQLEWDLYYPDGTKIPGGKFVTFGSENASVAAYDGNVVRAIAVGSTRVWIKSESAEASVSVTVIAAPTPPPPPVPNPPPVPLPPPPPVIVPNGMTLSKLLGPLFLYPSAMALGGPIKTWAQRWADKSYTGLYALLEATRWAANQPTPANWGLVNYYDRAAIDYAFAIMTGDGTLMQHAHATALDYRAYVLASGTGPPANWMMPDGVAAHYLATGDLESRRAVGFMADLFAGLTYKDHLAEPEGDNRVQAYYVKTLLDAWAIGAPSLGIGAPVGIPGGTDWAAELRSALGKILAAQTNGAWQSKRAVKDPMLADGKPVVHVFTNGLLCDALARYYDLFEADARIVAAMKTNAAVLWASWMPDRKSLPMFTANTTDDKLPDGSPAPAAGRVAAPDLNMIVVRAFSFLYRVTHEQHYRDKAMQIIEGAVEGAWLSPDKQINQSYTSGFRAIADLAG